MKIGIDAHSLEESKTGTGRYLSNLLKHWKDQDIVLYFKKTIPDGYSGKVLNTNSNALFIHWFLPRAAKKDKIDILFCPNYIAPVFYRGKIALVLHDIIYEARPDLYDWPSIFDRILLRKVSKISAKKTKIIFTCSEFSKKEILKYYKVDSKKVHVVPLAVDEKFKDVGLKKSYLKKKFILYVGAIFNRRFVHQAVEAFEKISDKLPEYKFLVVGKNYTGQKIKQDKRIIHKDYVNEDDLVLLYNIADLFVWLSGYEGFGMPPLEAMACGTPVLSTKKTSLAEVLGDYPIWVENPKDIDEISSKMYKILTDKNLREKLIKVGLAQAQKFSWQRTAEETLRILLNYESR